MTTREFRAYRRKKIRATYDLSLPEYNTLKLYLDGYTLREISETLNVSAVTIGQWLDSARKKFRKKLKAKV